MPPMPAKPKHIAVGDEVELVGKVGLTVDRDDGLHVAVHVAAVGIITVHERWVERIDGDTPIIMEGENVRLRGVVRKTLPHPDGLPEQLLSLRVDGYAHVVGANEKHVATTGRRR